VALSTSLRAVLITLVDVGAVQLDVARDAADELAQERRPERLGFEGPMSLLSAVNLDLVQAAFLETASSQLWRSGSPLGSDSLVMQFRRCLALQAFLGAV
jgi:hypothetical protein